MSSLLGRMIMFTEVNRQLLAYNLVNIWLIQAQQTVELSFFSQKWTVQISYLMICNVLVSPLIKFVNINLILWILFCAVTFKFATLNNSWYLKINQSTDQVLHINYYSCVPKANLRASYCFIFVKCL